MKLNPFRIALLIAFILASLLWLLASGLINRWYGQIIGDTLEVNSKILTEFRKEATSLRAFIVIPIAAKQDPQKRFPALYHLHGFGADYQDAAAEASKLRSSMRRHPETELIHVYLDVSLGDGYHYFVNSANSGPWENALIQDFIPEFERRYPVIGEPKARFLTGHSSGGWSAIWLQINHPEFFGGVWGVSPDPLNFKDFFGVNLTEDSHDNFYLDSKGKARKVARSGKLKKLSVADYIAESEEDLDSHCDSDLGSYECAFSPITSNGQPALLFDRSNGKINSETALAWSKFDISKILLTHWEELGPKLIGKLHLFCGSEDDFFLDQPFIKFCNFLKEKGVNDACELVEGRGHGSIYLASKTSPMGLSFRIQKEARAEFLKSRP